MHTKSLYVRGMTCNHCKMSVEDALKNIDGVSFVEVDLTCGNVKVIYDASKASLDSMKEAVEDQGYDVE